MAVTRKPSPPAQGHLDLAISLLAGGLSTRMGRDKSKLTFKGKSLLGHVRTAAKSTGWPIRIIRRDSVSRCGPVGGIYTALSSSPAAVEMFLACDMPFISPALLRELALAFNPARLAAFAFLDGRAGFPFLIRKSALPVVKKQIDNRDYSLQSLAGALRAQHLQLADSRRPELVNLNSPEDVAVALAQEK